MKSRIFTFISTLLNNIFRDFQTLNSYRLLANIPSFEKLSENTFYTVWFLQNEAQSKEKHKTEHCKEIYTNLNLIYLQTFTTFIDFTVYGNRR